MKCLWNEVLAVLPIWMREEVDRLGKEKCREIRLRCNAPPEVVLVKESRWLNGEITQADIQFCLNVASDYSPWTSVYTSRGFIAIPGGHRIGLCGDVVVQNGNVTTFRNVRSVCIRVARDIATAGANVVITGSCLILGAPGWGKTTLLRNLARNLSRDYTVTVVDERGELFPEGFRKGRRMDVLTGCPKTAGIDMALRTMCPEYIVVDEITAGEDCTALKNAVGCGVNLLASAHASSLMDLKRRPIYQQLLDIVEFEKIIILKQDQTYTQENGRKWN